ncbi:hypothetical protein WMF28_24690 [Sorangium sp. So ce590]|uniref:hypothetical protein n=1 Tax=Sorangium sp. So ce590 TaxID=3133317 RepID=UPI003F5F5CED
MIEQSLSDRIHRTWATALIDANMRELAALIVDAELSIDCDSWGNDRGILVDLPASSHIYATTDPATCRDLERTLKAVATGHLTSRDGNPIGDFPIDFRVKLLDVQEDWRAIIKDLIVNAKDANQGEITEKVFARRKRQALVYNEMKFGSRAEIRVAQEFEKRQILFFPLPLAVRHETGQIFKDHREVDFLVCVDGLWGILEVAYHPDRYEQDAEKDLWFKKSGILCIQHYTSERCYAQTAQVVDEFLTILGKHKK